MKKTFTYCSIGLILIFFSLNTHAQKFSFSGVNTDVPCYDGSNYTLHSSIKITGVKVVDIYYDDHTSTGTGNSFSYEIVFTYDNIFTGQVNSTGNFYTYTVTMYTDNPLAGGTITNNGSNIPLTTDSMANMNLHNNPTYHYSAFQMGLLAGVTYYDAATIAQFGYDSVSLVAAAPCLNVNEGGIPDTNTPLFTTLSNFLAKMDGDNAFITWITQTETDNSGFTIQKSNDGKSWIDIKHIASQALNGNSIRPLSYTATDDQPGYGILYYRLIQADKNGHKTISKTAVVINNTSQNEVTIYPNPASDKIHIYRKTPMQNETFYLKNMAGKTVKSGKITGNEMDIYINDVSSGTYFLQIGNYKQKLSIVH